MKNLKSCPCCGSAAHMITRPQIGYPSGHDGYLSTIKCLNVPNCGLQVSAWALKKGWAIESATTKWNRRAHITFTEPNRTLVDLNEVMRVLTQEGQKLGRTDLSGLWVLNSSEIRVALMRVSTFVQTTDKE